MDLTERLTYSTVLIHCEYENGLYGSGTGFIFSFCKNGASHIPCVVTNKHVIEGAKRITFEFCKRDEKNNPIDKDALEVDATPADKIFHPSGLDLCCIPFGGYLNKIEEEGKHIFYTSLDFSIIPNDEVIDNLHAIEDLVMVGYPIGLEDRYNHKPVIRKGITATHFKNDYQGKKEFLVDMACFPGSSGSPIFICNTGSYNYKNTLYAGDRIWFLGILYGGPQYSANGTLNYSTIPNCMTITQIPTNLGIAIKSSELYAFEKYFEEHVRRE